METTFRTLPRPLTDQEKIEIAEQMVHKQNQINEIEDLKKKLNPLRADLASLSKIFDKNSKDEQVECYWSEDNPEPGQKTLYRMDTGEEIEVAAMTVEDNQTELDLQTEPDVNPLAMEIVPDELEGNEESEIIAENTDEEN